MNNMSMSSHHHMELVDPTGLVVPNTNPLTFVLFTLAGILIPVGCRLTHCRSPNQLHLGRYCLIAATGCILLGAGAWTVNAMDSLPSLVFLPFAAVLSYHVMFCESSVSLIGDEFYLPFSVTSFSDGMELFILTVGACMPLFGLYGYLSVTETKNFMGDVIGHFIPGAFVALSAQVSIRFHRKKDFIGLQRVEGLIMVSASIASMIMHVYGNHGSIFRSLFHLPDGNWMKNEQHMLDLGVWFTSGALALAYYYSEHQTGVHMLIPGICNFLVMTYHPQPNELMSLLHWSFGGLFLVASLFRVVEKIPEFAFISSLAGLSFIFGTPVLGRWAITLFAPSSYFLFLIVSVGTCWAMHYAIWFTPLIGELSWDKEKQQKEMTKAVIV